MHVDEIALPVHSFDMLCIGGLQAEHGEGDGKEKPHVTATTVTTITAQSLEDKSTKERTQQVCVSREHSI